MSVADFEQLALLYKALGDKSRLRILQMLPTELQVRDTLVNVNHISAELGIPQPTVSHHLKILKQAGVIRFHKRSNSVYYYQDSRRLDEAWSALNQTVLHR